MLVELKEGVPVGTVFIGSAEREASFLVENPGHKKSTIAFEEEMDLYEYVGEDFILRSDWVARKAAKAAALPVATPAPEVAKAVKLREVEQEFVATVNVLKTGYTDEEVTSWYRQEAEARAFKGNPAASTVLLDAISGAKGKAKSALADSVIALADAYAVPYGNAIGALQLKREALDAIDLLAVDAIAQIEAV